MYIYTNQAHLDVCSAITAALSTSGRLNGHEIMATVQDDLQCPRAAVMMGLLELSAARRIQYERGPSGCFRWYLLPSAHDPADPNQ